MIELNEQVYTVLAALTDGESFDIVTASGPGNGFDAWRRLCRRWDPYTTGRAISLLRDILSPSRANLTNLQGAVEKLEDLMRRYCSRRDSSGILCTFSEDIRMAAFEALVPQELERHVHMNRSRLDCYRVLREEVVAFAEARGGVSHG